MKHLKMLGLVALATMAFTAFVGAGSASAMVLCKVETRPCPKAQDWGAGETFEAALLAEPSTTLKNTSGNLLNTCTSGTLTGKTETQVAKENL